MMNIHYSRDELVEALKEDFIELLNHNQALLKMNEDGGLFDFEQEDFNNNAEAIKTIREVLKLYMTEDAYDVWMGTISSGYS